MNEFLYGVLSCFGIYVVISLTILIWLVSATQEGNNDRPIN